MQIDFLDKNVFVMGGTSGINLGIAHVRDEAAVEAALGGAHDALGSLDVLVSDMTRSLAQAVGD